jgi:hypothetical protein
VSAHGHWQASSATTTGADRTARSGAYRRSAAFTTSVGSSASGLKTSPSRQRGRARTAPCPSVAVDTADRFWPDVTRLVVAIVIAVLSLSTIVYVASATLENSG